MKQYKDVEAYLAAWPDDVRTTLEKVRASIRAAAPDAVESIAYGMPAYKYKGKPLIYFGAAKKHCALYGPAVESFQEDLSRYDVSKGTVRFPVGKAPPATLVRKLVRSRMGEIDGT